jgi:hypothetical protein
MVLTRYSGAQRSPESHYNSVHSTLRDLWLLLTRNPMLEWFKRQRPWGVQTVPETSNNSTATLAIEPTRRQFAAMGAIATAALGWSGSAAAAPIAVSESSATVATGRGAVTGKLFTPEAGEQPGLVMYAFAAASPSANAAVARQLAEQGWSVLLVDAPADASPQAINRDTRAHVAWLKAQPGVVGGTDDYRLRNVGATFPKLSLASRTERQAASKSAVLFAVPTGRDSNTKARAESLSGAARALHRIAAGTVTA